MDYLPSPDESREIRVVTARNHVERSSAAQCRDAVKLPAANEEVGEAICVMEEVLAAAKW